MVKEDSEQIIDNHLPIPPGYELLKHVEPPVDGKPRPVEEAVVKKTGGEWPGR